MGDPMLPSEPLLLFRKVLSSMRAFALLNEKLGEREIMVDLRSAIPVLKGFLGA